MNDRITRFSVAVLLTGMDFAVFEHSFSAIWLVWSGIAWVRLALVLLFAVWTGAAAVLWLHVYYDLRQVLRQRHGAFKLNPSPMPNELRGDGDV